MLYEVLHSVWTNRRLNRVCCVDTDPHAFESGEGPEGPQRSQRSQGLDGCKVRITQRVGHQTDQGHLEEGENETVKETEPIRDQVEPNIKPDISRSHGGNVNINPSNTVRLVLLVQSQQEGSDVTCMETVVTSCPQSISIAPCWGVRERL